VLTYSSGCRERGAVTRVHPNDLALAEFAEAPVSCDVRLSQHIERCERCSLRLAELRKGFQEEVSEAGKVYIFQSRKSTDYTCALSRFEHAWDDLWSFYQRERSEAPALFVQLAGQSAERQNLLVHNSGRFHTWGLFELLVNRSQEQIFGEPQESERLARLALKISAQLDPLQYGGPQIQDLRARAWGYIANSFRLRFDLRRSREAFEVASFHLRMGTGDSFERAMILNLNASLLKDQRRFDDALRIMRRVALIFRELADPDKLASALVSIGSLHFSLGDPRESIRLLSEADALLDPRESSRLLLSIRHNQVDSLITAGCLLEARHLLGKSRELYRQFTDPSVENRHRWVRAKLASASKSFVEAEKLFKESNQGFVAADRPYDSALVSLDLASLYMKQGRKEEATRLKAKVRPILSSQGIEADPGEKR
jgi:tetratricopeptide (TPR) repeat protein